MNTKLSRFKYVAIILAGISAASINTAAHANWSIMDLGTLRTFGDGGRSIASGINDSGQISGNTSTNNFERGFITGPNGVGMTALDKVPSDFNFSYNATGINESGQVVGNSQPNGAFSHAFITGPNGVGITDLGTLGGNYSYGAGINNAGQVAGASRSATGIFTHAFITGPNGTGMIDLGVLGGEESAATAINDSGQVVGYSDFEKNNFVSHAFITGSNGIGMTDLGTLEGKSTFADGINNTGQVVGVSSVKEVNHNGFNFYHAFVTGPNGVGMVDLDPLLGVDVQDTYANSINDSGDVVGYFGFHGDYSAFFINHDFEVTDLSQLDPVLAAGWTNLQALDINNNGQIVGSGLLNGVERGFLLSPVPEPETYAMLLAGLGIIGFMVHRRKETIV